MSDAITVITPKSIEESQELSRMLAASRLMPEALSKRPEDILATLLTGAELGLAPMQAIRGIHIIRGKASLSADLMGALVKRRSDVCEYLQLVESTAKVATWKTKRKGDPDATSMSFTFEDAKAAGLTSNDNYRKYPANMLRARCLAAICRAVYPDLCLGLYDSESGELADEPLDNMAGHASELKERLRSQIVDAEFVEEPKTPDMHFRINAAATLEELTALVPEIAKLPEADRAGLREVYAASKARFVG